MKRPVACIDFDGVLHNPQDRVEGRRMGRPVPGAQVAMLHLVRRYEVIVLTARSETRHVEDWLNYFAIPYDEVTKTKPMAEFYLDDKAVRFTDWAQALHDIKEFGSA